MLFNSVPWSKLFESHGIRCREERPGSKEETRGKRKEIKPSWPAQRKVLAKIAVTCAHSNWFTILMQRLTESHHNLGGKKSLWENTMSATDHYVMINWIGHKNIPYIWASVAIITKACTLGMLSLLGLWQCMLHQLVFKRLHQTRS